VLSCRQPRRSREAAGFEGEIESGAVRTYPNVTNLEAPTAEFVMAAYHQLWQIEKSFRMFEPSQDSGKH
jgi:hypothetical protein